MKSSFLERLLERADRVGPEEIQSQIVRLAEDKDFLETIFNTLQEGVAVVDGEGKITYRNRAAGRFLGLPETGELGTWTLGRSLRGFDWKQLLRENRSSSGTIEVSYPESRILNYYFVPLEKSRRAGGLHAAIFQDVTRERAETKSAVEAGRVEALTLLAAGVAHELGNPLNSLHLHLQIMTKDLSVLPETNGERIRESIGVCQQEIRRMDSLITQFLRAIRPHPLQKTFEYPVAVLEEALLPLNMELKDREILLEKKLSTSPQRVPMDREQMKQAIYNVVRNAMQAAGEQGLISIQIQREGDFWAFECRDNGPGISPDHLPHLGSAFFTTRQDGTGLGLMIVHRIAREHGGAVQITSREGKGTSVKLQIPLQEKRVHLLAETSAPGEVGLME
jgi:signal transduction histidine kinase